MVEQASFTQISPIQPPKEKKITRLFKNKVSKSVTLAKETSTLDKDITFKEVARSIKIFNSYFITKIKDPGIKIKRLIKKAN